MNDRFQLLERIGKGGMGVVWKARDAETGHVVALKLLYEQYADDPEYLARFEREVDVARRIESANVVRVLGYGQRGAVPFIAMEYVDGRCLREHLKEHGPFAWDRARSVIVQVFQGLAAAHAQNVLHRDIKPSNILLTEQNHVKIVDFGIARAADLTRLTGGSTMLGTPTYMAPEGQEDVRSEVYSAGVVLYELLTGAPPFAGDSMHTIILKHVRELPDLTRAPVVARPLLGKLLEKDSAKRPQSAGAVLALLGAPTGRPAPARLAPAQTPGTQERSAHVPVEGADTGGRVSSLVGMHMQRRDAERHGDGAGGRVSSLVGVEERQISAAKHDVVLGQRGGAPAGSLAFDNGGRTLAAAYIDGRVTIWACDTGEALASRATFEPTPRCMAFAPNGTLLAVGLNNGSVQLWRLPFLEHLASLEPPRLGALTTVLAFSGDGQLLVTAGIDTRVTVWNVHSGRRVHELATRYFVRDVGMSADGRHISAVAGTDVHLWETATGAPLPVVSYPDVAAPVRAVLSADGATVTSTHADLTLRVRLARSENFVHDIISVPGLAAKRLVFARDGRWVAYATDAEVVVMDAGTFQRRATLSPVRDVREVALSWDAARVAVANGDGTVRVWQVR